MGYRSINLPTSKPWDYSLRDQPFNGQNQSDALEALFVSFENKSWWAGGFIWKWFPNHTNSGGNSGTTFSPHNKPAKAVIGRYLQIGNSICAVQLEVFLRHEKRESS